MKLSPRMVARWRLFRIYLETGNIPWRKPEKKQKRRGVYMGAREALIPFLNQDAKRTFTDLIFRPGYLMRDYIQRGRHEQYLAPFTALLVFYSVFTLLTAVVQPSAGRYSLAEIFIEAAKRENIELEADTDDMIVTKEQMEQYILRFFKISSRAILLTRLDLHPEAADTPWKQSLAAVEANLRSKGIPRFLGNFLLLWLAMALLLRKYQIRSSGAAAASAYVLCQFCVFMALALLLTLGKSSELGILILGVLLFIDYHQWLQIGNRKALWLTIKTGLVYYAAIGLFYTLLGTILILLTFYGA